MSNLYKIRKMLGALVLICLVLSLTLLFTKKNSEEKSADILLAPAKMRSFDVDIFTVGELEASRSTIIASEIRGDQGKVIYLIKDGLTVAPGDLLVKMDPTPFEEKILELKSKFAEQESNVKNYEKAYEWEVNQAVLEEKSNLLEIESAELELNKVLYGDGPQEISALKAAMQKARIQYEELVGYSDELIELEKQGFLNAVELKQAQKKLQEEKDAYETSKIQYESFVNHVLPMQIKKAETALKRSKIKFEESQKTSKYKISKAQSLLDQSSQTKNELYLQLKFAEKELELSEIRAKSNGMVVLREEYRGGQRRKPRVGDILVKNQALLDLPDLDSLIVKTKVREVDLFKIAVGKPATIEVDAYPHLSFPGTVLSIGVLALSDVGKMGDEKFFEVRISIDNVDPRLRPGMTSRVAIHANKVQNALTIPLQALFEIDKKTHCYVSTQHGYELRPIDIGANNEQWVEILSGLSEGETLCLSFPAHKSNG